MNELQRNSSKLTATGTEPAPAAVRPKVVPAAFDTAETAPDRDSGVTRRDLTGRSRPVKAAIALVPTAAVAVGAIVVLSGGRHRVPDSSPSASAPALMRSHPYAGRPDSRAVTAQTAPRGGVARGSDCVVTITNSTVCGASAAQHCNLVISRALPQGPAATRRCVSQIRQFNRERSRAYELNEESSEPVHAGAGDG